MTDLRIPFAIDKATSSIVEVGSVQRGRQCGCVCPSCKQGVVARHGEVNVWHFAHDQDADDKPIKECDISFNSCCRQYAIELLLKGSISKVRTPDYDITELGDSWAEDKLKVSVTDSRMLDNIIVEKSSKYDIDVLLGEFSLFIFLGYDNRMEPMPPDDPKSGLLFIDIGIIKKQFYTNKSTVGLLKGLLKNLIEDSIEHKKWLYHPSEGIARLKLDKRLQKKRSSSNDRKYDPVQHTDVIYDGLVAECNTARNGQFTCVICNVCWHGDEFTDNNCPKCNKHIFSSFKADI